MYERKKNKTEKEKKENRIEQKFLCKTNFRQERILSITKGTTKNKKKKILLKKPFIFIFHVYSVDTNSRIF